MCCCSRQGEQMSPTHFCFAACYLCQKVGGTFASLPSHIWLRCGNRLHKVSPEGCEGKTRLQHLKQGWPSRDISLFVSFCFHPWHVAAYRMRTGPLGNTHVCMCCMHTHRCVFVCGLLRIKNASFCLQPVLPVLAFSVGGTVFLILLIQRKQWTSFSASCKGS